MEIDEKAGHRYPGIKPFERDEYRLFKGRDRDIAKLYNLISIENLVVLFSRSGLGKSSLLNAGLVNQYADGSNVVPVFIRFGAYFKENTESPVEKLTRRIADECTPGFENFLFQKLISPEQINLQSLWYKLKGLQIDNDNKFTYLLIFDQFEELFTYPDISIERLKQELAELLYTTVPQELRNRVKEQLLRNKDYLTKEEYRLLYTPLNVRLLFAIRSDKMSLLNKLKDRLPAVYKTCYELKPLNREQATDAIVLPAQLDDKPFLSPPFAYSNDVLENILDALTSTNGNGEENGREEEGIETFQLQIVCKHAEDLVIEKKLTTVSATELGDVKQIFENHYRNIIEKLSPENRLPARILIEERLIIDGTRVSMPVPAVLKDPGMTRDLLNELVATRILRPEDNDTVEVSHDTLVEPILKYYNERKEEERIAEETRQKDEEIKRINAEREKQLQEQRARSKRNRVLFSIITAALIVFAALAFYSFKQKRVADDQKKTFGLLLVASDTASTNPTISLRLLEAIRRRPLDSSAKNTLLNIGYRMLDNEAFYKTILETDKSIFEQMSFDGSRIITGTKDGKIAVYDSGGNPLFTCKTTDAVTAADFAADSTSFLTGSASGVVDEWSGVNGKLLPMVWTEKTKIDWLQYTGDKQSILLLADSTLKLVTPAVNKAKTIAQDVKCASLSPSGDLLVYGTSSGVFLCNQNGEFQKRFLVNAFDSDDAGRTNNVVCVAFSEEGDSFAAGYDDGYGTARVWNIDAQIEVAAVRNDTTVTSLRLFGQGPSTNLFTGLANGTSTWWVTVPHSLSFVPKYYMKGLNSGVSSIILRHKDEGRIAIFTTSAEGVKLWKAASSLHDPLTKQDYLAQWQKDTLLTRFLKKQYTDSLSMEQKKKFGLE